MFTHSEIWLALDNLAISLSISPSGLARRAGLDPTSFNRSKRRSASGKPRWPSTESLSKVLQVVGMSFGDFAALTKNTIGRNISVPVTGIAQASDDAFFDKNGYPVGEGWDEIQVPNIMDENCYALTIVGDNMRPIFRSGDRIIVAPDSVVQKGDRVIVKTRAGELLVMELGNPSEITLYLHSINVDYGDRQIDHHDVLWMGRIIWVSQ